MPTISQSQSQSQSQAIARSPARQLQVPSTVGAEGAALIREIAVPTP